MKVKHVFFDLDHTLWDFENNSKEALLELFHEMELQQKLQCTFENFLEIYYPINHNYWEMYRKGQVQREVLRDHRFIDTFKQLGYHQTKEAKHLSELYLQRSPYKKNLFDGALTVLNYLKLKQYSLHIITNGFNEVQFIKLRESGLNSFFESVTTSEEAGCNKPEAGIFNYALDKVEALPKESLMIGDNFEADVMGAVNAGLKAVWFNPAKEENKTSIKPEIITHLQELTKIL